MLAFSLLVVFGHEEPRGGIIRHHCLSLTERWDAVRWVGVGVGDEVVVIPYAPHPGGVVVVQEVLDLIKNTPPPFSFDRVKGKMVQKFQVGLFDHEGEELFHAETSFVTGVTNTLSLNLDIPTDNWEIEFSRGRGERDRCHDRDDRDRGHEDDGHDGIGDHHHHTTVIVTNVVCRNVEYRDFTKSASVQGTADSDVTTTVVQFHYNPPIFSAGYHMGIGGVVTYRDVNNDVRILRHAASSSVWPCGTRGVEDHFPFGNGIFGYLLVYPEGYYWVSYDW